MKDALSPSVYRFCAALSRAPVESHAPLVQNMERVTRPEVWVGGVCWSFCCIRDHAPWSGPKPGETESAPFRRCGGSRAERTCARLCRSAGAEMEQIRFLL